MSGGVAVVGGGSWGTTLAHALAESCGGALLMVRDETAREEINREHRNARYLPEFSLSPALRAVGSLEEAARGSRLIFLVVPTAAFREVARELAAFAAEDAMLVSAAKGFELDSFKRMTQVLAEEAGRRKLGALSGPNLAKEILARQPCATVVASAAREVVEAVAAAIHGPRFRVYMNQDVCGVEVGGAMKNIYAIASGVFGGLSLGANTQAMMMTRALAEMVRVGARLGARPATFMGLSGMGDLFVTCASPLSRNYRVGYAIGQGQTPEQAVSRLGMTAEGVRACKAVHQFARREELYLPLAEGVYRLLHEGASIGDVQQDLMTRRARYEVDDLP